MFHSLLIAVNMCAFQQALLMRHRMEVIPARLPLLGQNLRPKMQKVKRLQRLIPLLHFAKTFKRESVNVAVIAVSVTPTQHQSRKVDQQSPSSSHMI